MKKALYLPAVMGRREYHRKIRTIFGANLIGYWPLWEASGSVAGDLSGNGRNGTYTGVDLNNTPSKVGKPAPLFGAGDFVNVYSAGLSGAFGYAEGTFAIWAKVLNAGIWGDATARHCSEFRADTSNRIYIRRSATVTNGIEFTYIAGGTIVGSGIALPPTTNWIHLAITWSSAADAVKAYFNGSLVGTYTGLGTWAGALAATNAVLGAANTSAALPWSGWLSDAFLLNRPATAEEIIKSYHTTSARRMAIIGDSIPNNASEFPYYVQDTQPAYVIFNHAIAGSTIISHMDAQVTAAANDNANTIIINLGTNDDNAGNMATLQAEVEENLQELKASNPNATLYYMNVLPRWTDSGGGTPVDKSNIRTAIAAACAAQAVTCWDTFTDPWITAAQTSDGIHPTAAGHLAIAVRITALLS